MNPIAISNIVFAGQTSAHDLASLESSQIVGVEVAPGRVWTAPIRATSVEIREFRTAIATAQLQVSAFHALTFERPDLTLFGDRQELEALEAYVVELGRISHDVGCDRMVWGSPTTRRSRTRRLDRSLHDRAEESVDRICSRLEPMGVSLLFENLWPQNDLWCGSVAEIISLIRSVDRQGLGLNLDLRALVESGEGTEWLTRDTAPHVQHVHVSDPGLEPPTLATHMRSDATKKLVTLGYVGWIALEVRRPQPEPKHDWTSFLEGMVGVVQALMRGS